MPAGRPTKYSAEMLELAQEFIDNHDEHGCAVPMAAGMALALGVSKATIYNWADQHPEFLDTLAKMNAKQELMLASGGLRGEYNAAIAKLMLHNHGYKDALQHGNDPENPIELPPVMFTAVCKQPEK